MSLTVRRLASALLLSIATAAALAAPGGPQHDPAGPQHGRAGPPAGQGAPAHQWYDGAHGHARYYPTPGWVVHGVPQQARPVYWGGAHYRFFDGTWYTPGSRGYVVVRPPFGIVVGDLPLWRTVVVIGGLSYYYANSVYYRELSQGGYEVVPPPTPLAGPVTSAGPSKDFVYPSRGQSAQQQATDEYDCHRWAVSQAGFDPTAAATGQSVTSADPGRRGDYARARSACLEGRGYTVR